VVRRRLSASVQTDPDAYTAPYRCILGLFQRIKRSGHSADHPPLLAQRLKKERSYNSTPSLGLRVLF